MSCPMPEQEVVPTDLPKVVINGVDVPQEAISEEVQYHPADTLEEAIQGAIRALTVRELLKQRAEALSIEADNEDARTEKLLQAELQTQPADEEGCLRYYQSNPEKFCSSPLMIVSHILLPATKDDIEKRIELRKAAEQIVKHLNQHPDDFEKLAKDQSACPSKNTGGSLGQLSKGQTAPEFERQVFCLPKGLCESAIETRYGFHIVRVDEKIDGEQLPFEAVKDRIADYIMQTSRRKDISYFIAELMDKAEIEGVELSEEFGPLVQ